MAGLLDLSTADSFGCVTLCVGAVLCVVGYFPPSLASTQKMSVELATPTTVHTAKKVSEDCQMSRRGKNAPG